MLRKRAGAMSRITIFAKGNLDVRDTLHSLRLGQNLAWNGVNEVIRERGFVISAHVRHETCTRSDALLEANGRIPEALAERTLQLGAFPLASQFGQTLFEVNPDAYVLSIQPEVHTSLLRHRRDGFLFYPHNWHLWPAADRLWLRESFVNVGFVDVAESMDNMARLVGRIQARSQAPILIYNLSSVVPGDLVHVHQGMDDILSTRIKRFNIGLIELSQQTGISIIDVDAILARGGTDRMKFDSQHFTGDGCRAVATEVVRILGDVGCLPSCGAGA